MADSNTTTLAMVGNCDPSKKQWWIFLVSSLLTLVGGVLLVLCGQLIIAIHKKVTCRTKVVHVGENHITEETKDNETVKFAEKQSDSGEQKDDNIGWVTAAKDGAGELISGQTTSGRILVSKDD